MKGLWFSQFIQLFKWKNDEKNNLDVGVGSDVDFWK